MQKKAGKAGGQFQLRTHASLTALCTVPILNKRGSKIYLHILPGARIIIWQLIYERTFAAMQASSSKGNAFARARAALWAAFPHTLPVLMGFSCLGLAYGVLMSAEGYGAVWSLLMSAIAFCGSMQYVAITLLTTAFDPVQAFLMSLMVNARHLFYGLSMLPKYRGMGRARNVMTYMLCDETFSIVCSVTPPPGVPAKDFYLAVSVLDYLYWVAASFLGGLLGEMLTFDLTGLDFVLTALIFVLFLDKWEQKQNRLSALAGVAAAIMCLLIFGAQGFIVPAMLVILAALLLGRNRLCRH